MNKKINRDTQFNIYELLIVTLTVSVLACIICYMITTRKDKLDSNTNDIDKTYNEILDNYYGNIDSNELSDAAIDGMMKFLDERYSTYLDSEDTTMLNNTLDGKYHGVGIQIIKNNNNEIEIYNVYDNTPAKKAGLKVGDIIISVNGEDMSKYEPDQVAGIIKDLDKTKMIIRRENETKEIELDIKDLYTPVVSEYTYQVGDKLIGRIYLEAFSKDSSKQFKSALVSLENKNIDSLIIDVRSNSGGYLNSAKDILDLFIKKGKAIYQIEDKDGKNIFYSESDEMRKYPIIVLIDSASASASEILAISMKESYGALIVGTTSYGKGTVQQTNTLSDDTMVKFTTAKWLSPNGNSINEVGITPGVFVPFTIEYITNPNDSTDPQLQKALELLSK